MQAQYSYIINADNTITITGYYGVGGAVTIPASINGLIVSSVGDLAFYRRISVTSVTIPVSVTSVGDYAFHFCYGLTNVYFKGNAPTVGVDVLGYDDNATVYFLPGTTGWVFPFADLPAVLWNPLIQAGGGSFSVQNNQFGFNITGTANIPIVVEACADLASPVWTPLHYLTLTNGSVYFSEPVQGNGAGRYYRIGSP